MRRLLRSAYPLVLLSFALGSGAVVALDGGPGDAGASDAGAATDAGALDGGVVDSGALDGGALDGGAVDSGALDSGALDAGVRDGGIADGGLVDASVGDGGPPDAGMDPGIAEGALCDPFDDQCASGLLCLAYPFAPDLGTCARDCGVYDDGGVLIDEDSAACTSPQTCQRVLDTASFEDRGTVCLAPQPSRDAVCRAPGDDGACSGGMDCHVAAVPDPDLGTSAAEFRCKVGCDKSAPEGQAGCAANELCFSSRIVQDFELDPGGAPKSCSVSICASGAPNCQCDLAAGFECVQLEGGPGGDVGSCALLPGTCGIPSRGVVAADLEQGFLPLEVICNDVTQHRFCDQRGFPEIDGQGTNLCILQGQLGDTHTGLCFPFCSVPSADLNGDGALGADEQGFELGCPTGQRCYDDVARQLYLANGPSDFSGPYGLRACDPVTCPPGQPCPAQCGPGDTECVTIDDGVSSESVCLAFFGSCEPARHDDPDAGPGGSDAGEPPTDGGAGGGDDGGGDDDAGSDAGAPTPGSDGGLLGGERGLTRRGCGCDAPSAGGTPVDGALAGLAALALIGLARRRRCRGRQPVEGRLAGGDGRPQR